MGMLYCTCLCLSGEDGMQEAIWIGITGDIQIVESQDDTVIGKW
jgi:hypothetical protein